MKYKVDGEEFDNWTDAQHRAVELLNSAIEYVRVFEWNNNHKRWGLVQELNLERGILPKPNWSTWTLAPYYVKQYYNNVN